MKIGVLSQRTENERRVRENECHWAFACIRLNNCFEKKNPSSVGGSLRLDGAFVDLSRVEMMDSCQTNLSIISENPLNSCASKLYSEDCSQHCFCPHFFFVRRLVHHLYHLNFIVSHTFRFFPPSFLPQFGIALNRAPSPME